MQKCFLAAVILVLYLLALSQQKQVATKKEFDTCVSDCVSEIEEEDEETIDEQTQKQNEEQEQ